MRFNLEISKKELGNIGEALLIKIFKGDKKITSIRNNIKNGSCELDILIETKKSLIIFEVKSGIDSYKHLRARIDERKIKLLINCLRAPTRQKDVIFMGAFVMFNKNLTRARILIMPLSVF